MKKIIAIAFILFMSGCASSNLVEWDTDILVSGYDFREYTEKGFLFTPEIYRGSYEAIGLVQITFVPRIFRVSNPNRLSAPVRSGFRRIAVGVHNYYVELPDTQQLITEMYELASNMGANALSSFDIMPETVNNNGTDIPTIRVSGFAIKRLYNE